MVRPDRGGGKGVGGGGRGGAHDNGGRACSGVGVEGFLEIEDEVAVVAFNPNALCSIMRVIYSSQEESNSENPKNMYDFTTYSKSSRIP
jgi:hypothetical protein